MILWLGGLIAIVLAVIATLHVYWAAGGGWGSGFVVPQRPGPSRDQVFSPGAASTLGVALALSVAAMVVAVRSGLIPVGSAPFYGSTLGTWGLSVVFLLRAVGEFRFVGFFKRVKETPFARADSAFFSPLCLGLAIGCGVIARS